MIDIFMQRCDELVEPTLLIDTNTQKIIYRNKACQHFQLLQEKVTIQELTIALSCSVDGHAALDALNSEAGVCQIKDVALHAFEQGEIIGDVHIGYTDISRQQAYFIFFYHPDQITDAFLKTRCYEAIYTASRSYPFRLDIPTKTIYFIGPILKEFNLPPLIQNYPQPVLESGVLHKDDEGNFKNMVARMYNGESPIDSFRTFSETGEELWYQPEYVVNHNALGDPIEVIGLFVYIQERRELEKKLHHDELTSCLNKATFQQQTTEIIAHSNPNEQHALLIMDIDNFKSINDNLGHQFGDSVLRSAGQKLKKIFHNNDYIGRIGGDEFMVFVKSVDNLAALKERVSGLVQIFDNTYKGKYQDYRTTASVGIALYPTHAESFETLYNQADVALYHTKNNGKNGYTIYSAEMLKCQTAPSTPIDTDLPDIFRHFDQKIIVEVFALLTDAKDYEASVNKVLELLGRYFKANRSYIFTFDTKSNKFMRNINEWSSASVAPHIHEQQALPQELVQPLIDAANEQGVLACQNVETLKNLPIYDMLKSQDIQSMLISFNKKDTQQICMIGFDDCKTTRSWSQLEIGTLIHASKIINQFLLYMIALKQIES